MAYPTLAPTARAFTPGSYPIKNFRAQSGAEVRILYGSQRTGMTLALSYDNITDASAALFVAHYDEVQGTYQTFSLPVSVRSGWSGSSTTLDVTGANAWRYDDAPQITAVRPGISSVQIRLIGVL